MPTSEAALLALRTQQVIASETGVTETVDPFGGSYYVERLTDELETRCWEELETIDGMGGMVAAVERGYPQAEIAKSSYEYQRRVESGDLRIVGVNAHQEGEDRPIETLAIDEAAGRSQEAKLAKLRRERDVGAVETALSAVRAAASGEENLMPPVLAAVRAYATLGEICDALRAEFGIYAEETAV